MSAFLCGEKHINALVNAAINWHVTDHGERLQKNKGQELVDILHNENIRSLCFRYTDDKKDNYPPIKFKWEPFTMQAVEILKLCSCYDYQACETEDYDKTKAAKLIDEIRHYAIRKLPGYEEAPWGI